MSTLSRRDFLKVAGIGSTALTALCMAGCSGSSNNGPSEEPTQLAVNEDANAYEQEQTVGFIAPLVNVASGDPGSFYPLKPAGGGKAVMCEVYEPLFDQDGPSGGLYSVIGKEFNWDGNDLNVEIYDNVYDTDGNHLTASDVVWYYNQMIAEGYNSQKYLDNFESCEALDDTHVVFHAIPEKADVFQNDNNLFRGACIVTQKAYEASTDSMAANPVATGRYKLTSYTPGLSATIERVSDDDYWQKDLSLVGPQHQANVQTINYYFITEAAQIVNALKTGQIDYACEISSTAAADFAASDEYTIYRFYSSRMFQTWFNCMKGAPLGDINLRAAVCYAMNSDDILAVVGGEDFARKCYEFCIPDVQFYNKECESWDSYYTVCDLDLAKDYLSKSSYAGQTLKIYYFTGEHADMEEGIALCIGAALDQLGVAYEITPTTDVDDLNVPANTNWDICLLTTGCNGNALAGIAKLSNVMYEGGYGNYYDDKLQELYDSFNTRTNASPEANAELQKYLIDNFYVYGTLEGILIDCWRNSVVANATTKTFRTWMIPGAWIYTE